MDAPVAWLLAGQPWVQYNTRIALLGETEDTHEVSLARQAMLCHPQVRALLADVVAWPGVALKRHNDAGHLLHKLAFLADLGVCVNDPGVEPVIERIFARQSPEGPFEVIAEIAVAFGGTGTESPVWMLCDAPTIVYALVKLGLGEDARVQGAARYLAGLVRENGWPCASTPSLGTFHGPGRRSDPCPYATLLMLKLLAQMPEWRDSPAARTGAETLLRLWEKRREQRPYLFTMGSDFAKLKAPLIWYDILHVVDVLTQFEWLRGDARLKEMLTIVEAKADTDGRFTPESVWRAWADWDFGQKRGPSGWMTLAAQRALARVRT